MIITNFQQLAKNDLRKKALEIAEAGYEAIEIENAVSKRIKLENNKFKITTHLEEQHIEFNLDNFKRIFIIGIGKGSAMAGATLAKILGDKLTAGIVLDVENKNNDEYGQPVRSQEVSSLLEIFRGDHPLPSQRNVEISKKIITLAESLKEDDLLITFICGGGSALFCGSEDELKAGQTIFKELTKNGATISELNVVRKHLSEVKGGGLAKIAYPATIISLIASDVCGNDLATIASGPTVYDSTTKEDAESILKKYGIELKNFHFHETPKEKKYFEKIKNILFICNQDAVMAMSKKAEELEFSVKINSLALQGEAKEIFTPMIDDIKPQETILAAGETTITFKKLPAGKGGRNQEAVLGALLKMIQDSRFKIQDLVIMSFASDGFDNTEAAGALGDYLTIEKAKELGLKMEEFLDDNHNSFYFFEKTGDLVYAEKKCFNVADLMLILKI